MGRPKAGDPSVTRERVLEAAAALFTEKGYEATTLSAIGARLGVSAAALYYHFDSKEEILFAYLESGLELVLSLTEQAVTAEDPPTRLRQLVRTYVLFGIGALPGVELYQTGVYGYFQLIVPLGEERTTHLLKLQRRYLDLIRSVLREGIDSGDFDIPQLSATAFGIVGMAAHAMHWYHADGSLPPEGLADTYADLALRMVTGPA